MVCAGDLTLIGAPPQPRGLAPGLVAKMGYCEFYRKAENFTGINAEQILEKNNFVFVNKPDEPKRKALFYHAVLLFEFDSLI